MKIAPAYRIEQFCEKHTESRFVLEYVLVTTFHGKPVAVAANGFICGVVPVEMDDEDIGGLVHRSIFDRRTAAERKMAIYLGPQHAATSTSCWCWAPTRWSRTRSEKGTGCD